MRCKTLGPAPQVLTDEEEANMAEIRREYERKFREIKNRDGRYQE